MAVHASDLGDIVPVVLSAHIAVGAVAVLAGFAAVVFRKGEAAHRTAGSIFVISMVLMTTTAAYLAWRIQSFTLVSAIVAAYVVITSWATIRRHDGRYGAIEVIGMLFVLGASALNLWMGWQALHAPGGEVGGYPPGPYLVFGSVGALMAATDLKVIVRGGITGKARIERHLWRMCMGLFLAVASFLTQGLRHILPDHLKGTALHWALIFVPSLIAIAVMIYWLIRVRFGGWYKGETAGA